GGRCHPDRVRHYRADRHPGRVPRARGDPGHLGQRVRRHDEAHQKRRSLLRVHLGGPGPGHRGGRRAGRAAGIQLLAGGPVRGVRAERRRRGVRAPGAARGVVGVGAGRLGSGHRTGPGPGRCRRAGPGRAADRRGHRHPRRDHHRAGPPGRRAPQPRDAVGVVPDLGRGRHRRGAGRRRVLGFVGFEQAPVLAEEARNARRTIPVATYVALGMIAVVYAGVSWAMAAHVGTGHAVAAAGAQGPGLLFGLGGSGALSQVAQWLFLTSLFAAALAFHNAVWRYIFALGRENVLPAALGRTGGNNIPKAASLTQSATGLAVIAGYALAHANPMTGLFFDLGTTGGFGILVLFAVTAVAVIAFFARDPRGENAWRRLVAPALAAAALGVIVVLAVQHYATLLGVPPGRLGAARQLRCRRGGRAGLGAGPQVPPPAGLRHHRARRPRRGPACPLPPGDAAMTPPRQADAGPAVVLADGSCAGVLSQVI